MCFVYLWAMVKTVLSLNSCFIVCWISLSVSRSTLAVASSMHNTWKKSVKTILVVRFCLTTFWSQDANFKISVESLTVKRKTLLLRKNRKAHLKGSERVFNPLEWSEVVAIWAWNTVSPSIKGIVRTLRNLIFFSRKTINKSRNICSVAKEDLEEIGILHLL